MARLSRIILPDIPHYVTQRGNRRQKLFLEQGDYALYRDLMAGRCRAHGIVCLAWCLMPNHVHLLLQPPELDSLSRAVGEAHRRYTAFINARARVTGHLFQGRFGCTAMDEAHLLNAVRYLAFNPVRAKLVASPADYAWCSVPAHLAGRDDELVQVRPVLALAPDFAGLLEMSLNEQMALDGFETRSVNGRPMGDAAFMARAEATLGRSLMPGKRGPKGRGMRGDG